MMLLAPVLTPHGLLTLGQAVEAEQALALEPGKLLRLERAFARGSGHGLLVLGVDEVGTPLPPVLSYWRKLVLLRDGIVCPSRYHRENQATCAGSRGR